MVIAGLSQQLCSGSSGLFSWSRVAYTIRELAVTPLEEGHREEEEGSEG